MRLRETRKKSLLPKREGLCFSEKKHRPSKKGRKTAKKCSLVELDKMAFPAAWSGGPVKGGYFGRRGL